MSERGRQMTLDELAARLEALEDTVREMDELILRLAMIVSIHLPSTDSDIATTFGEWQDIKREISESVPTGNPVTLNTD